MKNNIAKLRRERNITQEELASKMNVSRQTINAIENDKYSPSLELAFNIAKFFNLKVDDIFSMKF